MIALANLVVMLSRIALFAGLVAVVLLVVYFGSLGAVWFFEALFAEGE